MPSYEGLRPASKGASRALAGSKAADTRCEQLLRSLLWRRGLRFRKDVRSLPGRPDIVFSGPKLAVFCDGDFWHGKDWRKRKRKLLRGHNPEYWVAKIEGNIARGRKVSRELRKNGWSVVRVWESEILSDPERAADRVEEAIVLHEQRDEA